MPGRLRPKVRWCWRLLLSVLATANILGPAGESYRPGHGSCTVIPGQWGELAGPAWSHTSLCSWAPGTVTGKGNAVTGLSLHTRHPCMQGKLHLPFFLPWLCPLVCNTLSTSGCLLCRLLRSVGLNSSLGPSGLPVPPPMASTLWPVGCLDGTTARSCSKWLLC